MRHHAALLALPAAALVALSGCASMAPQHAGPAPNQAAPLARTSVATPPANKDVMTQLLAAQFALQHHDTKAAAAAYARAMMLSKNPEVAERATRLAIVTDDPATAKRAMQRWAALGATDAQLARARARLALASGGTAAARKQLEKLVASGGKQAWQMFGQVLMGARDPAQAGQLLETIATTKRLPDDSMAWLAMSELGEKLGRHDYARKIAGAAVQRFHCAQCYAWAAQLQADIGHDKAARTLYAKAVGKAPKDTGLRLGYAAFLAKAGDNTAAAQVMADGPQSLATFQARAAYAARARNKDELKRIYKDLQGAPDTVREQSGYLLGQLAITLGKPQQALVWFAKVPFASKHGFDADVQRVFLLEQQGKPKSARGLLKQMRMAWADDPAHLRKVDALGAALLMSEKHYTQAVTAYSHALKTAPDDTDLLYGRGIAYAQSGNVDAAVADFRSVLKVKPDDINALNALGFTLADANRDLKEAQSLIAQAHKARPDDPAITDSWGWVQYRLGHLDAAAKALQKAWKAGKDPEVGGHLAEVLWKRGNVSAARRVLDAARKLDPDSATLQALAKKIVP